MSAEYNFPPICKKFYPPHRGPCQPDSRAYCAASPCWDPCLSFYNAFLRDDVSPITVRDYLPDDLLRVVVLYAKGWWIGNHWRSLDGSGNLSYHGPKGEFQHHAPAEVLEMRRSQMVDFLLHNTTAQAVPCENQPNNPDQ